MTTITRLRASDVTGQKLAHVTGVPRDATVGEMVHGLLGTLSLPRNDVEGRPLTYQALLEREGRHLHPSESVGEVLQEEDRVVLQPHITAG